MLINEIAHYIGIDEVHLDEIDECMIELRTLIRCSLIIWPRLQHSIGIAPDHEALARILV